MRIHIILACGVILTYSQQCFATTFDDVTNNGSPVICGRPRIIRGITDALNRRDDTPKFLIPIPESTKGHRTPEGVECTTDFQLNNKSSSNRRLTYSLSLDQGKLKIQLLMLNYNPDNRSSNSNKTAEDGRDDTKEIASLPSQRFLTSSFFIGERPTSPTEVGAPMQVFLHHFPSGTWERGDGNTWIYRMRETDKLSGQQSSLDALFLDTGGHQVVLQRLLDNGQEADIRTLYILFVQFRAEGQGNTSN